MVDILANSLYIFGAVCHPWVPHPQVPHSQVPHPQVSHLWVLGTQWNLMVEPNNQIPNLNIP